VIIRNQLSRHDKLWKNHNISLLRKKSIAEKDTHCMTTTVWYWSNWKSKNYTDVKKSGSAGEASDRKEEFNRFLV
jgi:hypothetical protein